MTEHGIVPKKGSWRSILLSLFVTICFIALLGGTKFFQIRQAMAQHGNFQPPPEGVSVIKAAEQEWIPLYRVAGTIKAVQGVLLRNQEAGVVSEMLFESGVRVAEGEVLVKFDTSVERAELKSARAKLELTRTEFERATKLWEQKATSRSAVQSAISNRDQAESEVTRLEALIDRKEIKAPFGGRAGIRQIDRGEYLSPGAALVELQQVDRLYVDFAVPLRVFAHVSVGETISFAHEGLRRSARIIGIDPAADKATLTVNIRAHVTGETGPFIPGMYVGVDIPSEAPSQVVAIPITAIAYAPYGNSVFVLKRNGENAVVESRTVRLGMAIADKVPVLEGLKPGEEIVTAGAFKLRDGASVTVNNDVPAESDPVLPNT
jgi:membrane fusion protein (multidrug efflux system)